MSQEKIKKATIINIDCMNYMSTLEDNHFDLACVDPPYGINRSVGTGGYSRGWVKEKDKKWDKNIPDDSYFAELFRVSTNQIIWGGNYYHLPHSRGWVCWYKTNEVKGRDFSEFELAFTSFDRPARHYEQVPFIKGGLRIHPTQKPVKLYEWILTNYAKAGQRVLDTHLGSGSSAIACNNLGFEMVGCELDKDYYDAACKRIKHESSQERLFV